MDLSGGMRSEEERLWAAFMYPRHRIAETKRNTQLVNRLRKAGKLKNGQLPAGMIGEDEARRREWDAYRRWLALHLDTRTVSRPYT